MLEILLVEDNDDDARFIEKALDKQKHHLKRITNGELGFHYLLKPDVEPDVVLLDYYLPLMNGLEIIKKTKERGKNYAFLFLTVDNTVEVAVKAMKAGALDFLPKTGEYYSNLPDMIDKIYKLQSSRKEKEKAETALRENESRLKEAERIAHLGNWEWDIINGDLRWSNEFYRILGIEPQAVEAAMETYMERVHPDDIEHVKKTVKEMARGHKSCSNLEHRLVRPDGSERFISGQITVYFAENNIPAKLFGTMLDITGRKRAEEALQARSHELALLNSAGRAFVSSLELDQVLTTVLNQVRQIIGIVACCIWLVDPKSGDLVCREAASPRYKIVRGWRLSPGQDLAGWVIQHGESLNVPDIRIDRRHFKGVDKQTDLNLRSILGVPLQTKHGVFGVLQLVDEVENRFSPDDVRLAESLAMLAAVAIENARLYEQTQQDAATKAILLQEVNHRVKNNLAAIIGILYIEQRHAQQSGDQRAYTAFMDDLTSRIEGLSTVHQLLSDSNWSPLPLGKLARQVIDSALHTRPLDSRIVFDVSSVAPVVVTPKAAHNLALVINELATNVVKYAAPARESTQITVHIAPEPDGETVLFEFRDDGPGFPAAVLGSEGRNVGLYLIENTVRHTLRGEITLHNDKGAVATIRFPKEME